MDTIALSCFIGSSSNLQVTRTAIKPRTSSKSSHVRQLTSELRTLERKCCGHESTFILDRIFSKLADYEDRYKISDVFDFGSDRTIRFGDTCP